MRTKRGYRDYAKLRHQMLGSLSVDELLEQMRQSKRKVRRSRDSGQVSKEHGPRSRVKRRAR